MASRRNPGGSTEGMTFEDTGDYTNYTVYDYGQAGAPPPAAPPPAAPPPAAPPASTGGFNYDQFATGWTTSGGRTAEDLKAYIAAHPEFATGIEILDGKGDIIRLPDGSVIDAVRGQSVGGLGAAWHILSGEGAGGFGGAMSGAAGGAGSYGSGSASSGPAPGSDEWRQQIKDRLTSLFDSGGGFNQDIVNRRTDLARSDIERARKSFGASNEAALAERGLIGSGPEQSAQNRLDERMFDSYLNAASGIYSDEARAADQRMMQALSLATGMSEGDAQRAIDWFNAETGRTGTLGNLALGNLRAVNDYNLGMANYGLNREQLLWMMENGRIDDLIEIIEQLYPGANISAGGYY